MMPEINREERRKRRAPALLLLMCGGISVSVLFQVCLPAWQWLPPTIGIITVTAGTAIGVSIDPPDRPWRRGRQQGGRHGSGTLTAAGRDGDAPVGTTVPQWRGLVLVSRLMPGSAGRRWLAEADSLLSEITATRRGAAIRSYLRSAPRLALMMWTHEIPRRARLGPRRPG
jgi:hypothetical protein